jgi:endonuclease/exonuclease/phosphatase family metal-dependent hydrolase
MTSKIFRSVMRGLVGVLALAIVLVPTFTASSSQAGTSDPKYRKVTAPNVFYPVSGSRAVKDLRSFKPRHQFTDIKAACGAGVKATHPGTAAVWGTPGNMTVRISSASGMVTTYSSYLSAAWVTTGQIIQSGQYIGTVGRHPRSKVCDLYFSVWQRGKAVNPTTWLNWYVGRTPPVGNLFDVPGINVASFNVLGASHTRSGGRFATAAQRTPRALALINSYNLDVVGLQEFQDEQKAQFMSLSGDTFGIFHWRGRPDGPGDTDNSIIWRNSTMELVSTDTFDIPYFGGNTRHVPIVLLKQKSTGRTAYFMNVHNPADVQGPAQQWRNQAIAIERAKMIELRATGRPVFLTGDFNDRQNAFCPITAGKLAISPNSVPSTGCVYPGFSIDWIFVAGQARFSSFVRDTKPQSSNISDHPIVVTRAHLQN